MSTKEDIALNHHKIAVHAIQKHYRFVYDFARRMAKAVLEIIGKDQEVVGRGGGQGLAELINISTTPLGYSHQTPT